MKYVYYGFGGFIGFVCGILITLVFYLLEKSGHRVLTDLGNNYGFLGRHLAEMVNWLPYFGIVFGLVLVKILFKEKFEPENGE